MPTPVGCRLAIALWRLAGDADYRSTFWFGKINCLCLYEVNSCANMLNASFNFADVIILQMFFFINVVMDLVRWVDTRQK